MFYIDKGFILQLSDHRKRDHLWQLVKAIMETCLFGRADILKYDGFILYNLLFPHNF